MDIINLIFAAGAVLIVAVLVVYVINALGTMYVLKQLGFQWPWLAWIPIVNVIALGLTCDEGNGKNNVFGYEMPNLVLALFPVISLVVSMIPTVGSLLSVCVNVILGGVVYSIVYAKMEGKTRQDCQIIGFVTGLISLVATVKFLIYKIKGITCQSV